MLNPQEFEIKQWEAEVLIASFLKLTRSGTITWECLEYSPPMLIETDDLFISHELVAKTEYEGVPYLAEVSDTMDVKTGKGHIDLSVTIGDHACPGNGEAVGLEAQLAHELDVLFPVVVAIDCHRGIGLPRRARPATLVCRRPAFAPFACGTLILKRTRCRAPQEVVWKWHVLTPLDDQGCSQTLCLLEFLSLVHYITKYNKLVNCARRGKLETDDGIHHVPRKTCELCPG